MPTKPRSRTACVPEPLRNAGEQRGPLGVIASAVITRLSLTRLAACRPRKGYVVRRRSPPFSMLLQLENIWTISDGQHCSPNWSKL